MRCWTEHLRYYLISGCAASAGLFSSAGCPGLCSACPGCSGAGGVFALILAIGIAAAKRKGGNNHGMDENSR